MKQKQKNLVYFGLPLIGTILCLWYIKEATFDIVYTDYIRLVNSYLPDVWNPAKFFVPDVLTRIPIHYLGRIINVTFFGYSTTFDMVLGVLGLGLSGLVLAMYCKKQSMSPVWYLFLMILLFGLDKWEMLTNGTGWGHFLAFALFYYHYLVFDRMVQGEEKRYDRILLLILPAVITLGVAGPYCAVYTATLLLFYLAIVWVKRHQGEQFRYWISASISAVIPFLLYLWSNSYAVEDHAGAVDISLTQLLGSAPGFFPRFLLKSLASMVIGGETLTDWIECGKITDRQVYVIGLLIVIGYLLALYLNWKYRLYKETLLPLIFLVGGIGNHAIVLISRYIFLKENYGMSSRYVLQYQMGILGIILTIGLLWKRIDCIICRTVACTFCVILLMGHGYTNYVECKKAPYREEYGEEIAAMALQFEEVSDKDLREKFDYKPSRADSGEKVRQALTILKEQEWNIFRNR